MPLLILTGARKREVLDAKWTDFDLEQRIWCIPTTKAGKARHVPLSNGVMHLRSTMPRDSQWVFPNPDTTKPFVSVYCAWQTARTKAGLADAASNAATLAVGSVMGAMPNQVLDVPLVAA